LEEKQKIDINSNEINVEMIIKKYFLSLKRKKAIKIMDKIFNLFV